MNPLGGSGLLSPLKVRLRLETYALLPRLHVQRQSVRFVRGTADRD